MSGNTTRTAPVDETDDSPESADPSDPSDEPHSRACTIPWYSPTTDPLYRWAAGHRRSLRDARVALWVLAVVGVVADLATTRAALAVGLAEGNPIARWLLHRWGFVALAASDAVRIAGLVIGWRACRCALPPPYPIVAPLAGAVAAWSLAVSNGFLVVQRVGGTAG
jgi:hypothetical protein